MNDTRGTTPIVYSPSPDNNSNVVTTGAGANSTVTQCKHEVKTRIGKANLVSCQACGKAFYQAFEIGRTVRNHK